jgi:nuclear polyadenylated RNA-binding protein 3
MTDRGGRTGGHDRQDSRSVVRDEYGRILRGRDDYRPGRSPTPPRGNFRGHDGYGGGGDSYNGRERWRSRSRSPYAQRNNGRYRDRSPSPRRLEAIADAELEIPRREPHNIPDVQIILMTQLDRNFVSWVEGELHARGLKSEVLFLSPRLPLDAVIRRQIIEGVHAVSQLDMRSQNTSTIPLQVFNRQAGANNVRFDEYQDLEPRIAAELVIRARTQAAPAYPLSQPQYTSSQSYQPPAASTAPPNLANIVGQMDNASLQKLLGSMTTPQQQNAPTAASNSAVDLAGLLSGLKPQQPQYQPQPAADPYANSNLASLLGTGATHPPQPAPQQSAQQVQNIMAQLAKFRQ